jgi:hypothetical protein
MQKKHRKFRLEWNRIPRHRRHAYVYVLLLLGAIVGNNITRAIADVSEEAPANAPSHMENVKDRTNLLYR